MKREKREKMIRRSWKKAVRKWKCTNSFQLIDYAKPILWLDNMVCRPSIEFFAPGLLRNRKMYQRGQRIVAYRRYKGKRGL
jgi:hypothetical protein